MGQPGWLKTSHLDVYIEKQTRRTETSKYPEEEKESIDFLSSGERKGNRPNQMLRRLGLRTGHRVEGSLAEVSGKAHRRR